PTRGCPRAPSVDNSARRDKAAAGFHAADSLRVALNSSDLGVLPQLRAVGGRASHEANHCAVGIDKAVSRAKASANDVIGAKLRKHATNIVAGDEPYVFQSHRDLFLKIRLQIREMLFIGGAEQITLRPVTCGTTQAFVEAGVKRNGIERHLNVHGSRKLCAHSSHALARGTLALRGFAFEHEHVPAT